MKLRFGNWSAKGNLNEESTKDLRGWFDDAGNEISPCNLVKTKILVNVK